MKLYEIILQELNNLNESPDNVLLPSGQRINCEQFDAIPFVVNAEDHSNVFIGERGSYHFDFISSIEDMGIVLGYKGRVWLDSKVITFWDYPRDRAELLEILEGLEATIQAEENIKVNIARNPEYRIEVYNDVVDDDGMTVKKGVLIPLKDFDGEDYKAPDADHLLKQADKQRLKDLGLLKAYNTLYHNKRMEKGTKSKSAAEYKFAKERGIAENQEKFIDTDDGYLQTMISKQPDFYDEIKNYSITVLKQEQKRLDREKNNYRYGDSEYEDYFDKIYLIENLIEYKQKQKINELYNQLLKQPFLDGKIEDFNFDFMSDNKKLSIVTNTDKSISIDLEFDSIYYYDHTNDTSKRQDINKIIDPSQAILSSNDLKVVNALIKMINLYYKQNNKLIKPVLTDSKPIEKPHFTNEDFNWMIGLGGDEYKINEVEVDIEFEEYYKVIYLNVNISDGNIFNQITYRYSLTFDDAFKPKSENFSEYRMMVRNYEETKDVHEDVYDEIRKAILQINPKSKIVNTLRPSVY